MKRRSANELHPFNHNQFLSQSELISDPIRVNLRPFRWLETMQKGSWFFRVARKFGPLGKALKTLQRRRVFVRLSPDFRFVSLTSSEPAKQEIAKSQKATVIPLDVRLGQIETLG